MKRVLLATALGLLTCSCAFMAPRNRPLMNFCQRALVPDSVTGQVLAAPVTVPVCLAAGIVDTAVVHPIMVTDDAWFDTEAAIWAPTSRGYVTECALVPFRAALSPPIWAFAFTGRALFDVPPWPPGPARLERQLADEDHKTRLLVAADLKTWSYRGEDVKPATDAMLAACREYLDDTDFCEAVIRRLPEPLTDDARRYLAELAAAGQGRICAVAIWRLFLDCLYWPGQAGDTAAATVHLKTATDLLASLYDGFVAEKHHEAEVYLAKLARSKVQYPGPRSLALYIARSLAGRGWPDYAGAEAFRLQMYLLSSTEAARGQAVDNEWHALRLQWNWDKMVEAAIKRQREGGAPVRAELARTRDSLAETLRRTGPGKAALLSELTAQLMHVTTALDAEETAERLLGGPKADLALFLGDPRDLLRKKGSP